MTLKKNWGRLIMNQNNSKIVDFNEWKKNKQNSNLVDIAVFGNEYYNYLGLSAQKTVNQITEFAKQAYVLKGSPYAEDIVMAIQDAQMKRDSKKQAIVDAYERKLVREEKERIHAGYINGTILVYFVLVFGVLIALGLIIFQF